MTIATIDIGGTGIKFASLTPDGKILDKTSIPTPEKLGGFTSVARPTLVRAGL